MVVDRFLICGIHCPDGKCWQGDGGHQRDDEICTAHINAVIDVMNEIAKSRPTLDDSRIGYVEIQVDRESWEKIRG